MNKVRQWLMIEPLDTLFFRGSEPMIAGESHEVHSVFPPMPSTIQGALCTAMLAQQRIDPADFTREPGPTQEVQEKLPLLGTPDNLGFRTAGPVFHVQLSDGPEGWLFPAPANWFGKTPRSTGCVPDAEEMTAYLAEPRTDDFRLLGMSASVPDPLWVRDPNEPDIESLAAFWASRAAFDVMREGVATVSFCRRLAGFKPESPTVVDLGALFVKEDRVGIALEPMHRTAKTGRLYSSSHVRLRLGVKMVVGLSQDLVPGHLDETGLIGLGGEQRVARYAFMRNGLELPSGESNWIVALNHFPFKYLADMQWQDLPRVSGPLIRRGGWDMKRNFHKNTTAYLPAGTAINVQQGAEVPFGFIRI